MSELRTYPCYRTRYADSTLITQHSQQRKRVFHAVSVKPVRVIEVPHEAQN